RRRHTRSKRDWSSDVCSSDLSRNACCAAASAGVHANAPAYNPAAASRRTPATLTKPAEKTAPEITTHAASRFSFTPLRLSDAKKIGRASCRERVTKIEE